MILGKLKLILPMLGDFANGVFAVVFASWLLGAEVMWWHFLVGFVCALLPDLDALPEVLAHGQVGKKQEGSTLAANHRTYLHYPVIYLAVGLLVFPWYPYWGTIFLLGTLLHFVRDMLGTGWGVKALWPMSNKNYRFFSQGNDDFQATAALTDEETSEFAEEHGNSDWLEDTYLRLTWISGIEYALFLGAIMLLVFSLIY